MSSTMFRTNPAGSVHGFSVFQTALGAQLQFLPALGTPELDEMINAYIPGPASISEKRATISVDFCEYAQITGKTFKYYAVNPQIANTVSPADSGYGSVFKVSPVMSDLSWSNYASPSQSSTVAPLTTSQKNTGGSASKKTASNKAETTDFSHLPGMMILTKDGVDVTNTAARGTKTKEQRDHAHLMRILRACDACKKKKIRCDPSHKKRSASQVETQAEAKPAKKTKATSFKKPVAQSAVITPESFTFDSSMPMDFTGAAEESWDQFLQFDDAPATANPQDYDFFFVAEDYFSPATSGSVVSPIQPMTPANINTPLSAGLYDNSSQFIANANTQQQPTLPYLNSGDQGNNYVDFNLYSPASSFIDEELQPLKKSEIKSAIPATRSSDTRHSVAANNTSYYGLNAQPLSSDVSVGQEWDFDWDESYNVSEPGWWTAGAHHETGVISGVLHADYNDHRANSSSTQDVGLGLTQSHTASASIVPQWVSPNVSDAVRVIPQGLPQGLPQELPQGYSPTASSPMSPHKSRPNAGALNTPQGGRRRPTGLFGISAGIYPRRHVAESLSSATAHSLFADPRSGKDGLAPSTAISTSSSFSFVTSVGLTTHTTSQSTSTGLQGGLQQVLEQAPANGGAMDKPHAACIVSTASVFGLGQVQPTQLDIVHARSGVVSGRTTERTGAAVITAIAGQQLSSCLETFTTRLFTRPVRQSLLTSHCQNSTLSCQLAAFGLFSLLLMVAALKLHNIFATFSSSHSGLATLLSHAPLLIQLKFISSRNDNFINNAKVPNYQCGGIAMPRVSHRLCQTVWGC